MRVCKGTVLKMLARFLPVLWIRRVILSSNSFLVELTRTSILNTRIPTMFPGL